MNVPIHSTPLKQLPPFSVSLRMPCREEVVFHTQSVESGCGLENLTPLPENLPSQSVFYKKPTESIPEMVGERFIAGSPPSLLWSAPKFSPSNNSGQMVQGRGEPSPIPGQKHSVRLSAWSENPLSSPVVCGGKKREL